MRSGEILRATITQNYEKNQVKASVSQNLRNQKDAATYEGFFIHTTQENSVRLK
jgi:hypothetical protein